jgi:hypothetical protein
MNYDEWKAGTPAENDPQSYEPNEANEGESEDNDDATEDYIGPTNGALLRQIRRQELGESAADFATQLLKQERQS